MIMAGPSGRTVATLKRLAWDQPRARITMIIVVIAMVTCSSFIEAYPSSCREGYHASYVGLGVTSRCQTALHSPARTESAKRQSRVTPVAVSPSSRGKTARYLQI
ncbi:uncharacterized protein [Diadema antillarum]|uniref:uncharacterized protein n=1 Tax=Diadema antillarum TaxID=105358 RepID=UPI003A8B8F0A